MEKYISLNALLAEINRQQRRLCLLGQSNEIELRKSAAIQNGVYYSILSFINTLEVKDVDLEKHLKEDIEDVLFDLNGVAVKGATHYLTVEDVKDIAKHFYELGMVASNKAQKGEEV